MQKKESDLEGVVHECRILCQQSSSAQSSFQNPKCIHSSRDRSQLAPPRPTRPITPCAPCVRLFDDRYRDGANRFIPFKQLHLYTQIVRRHIPVGCDRCGKTLERADIVVYLAVVRPVPGISGNAGLGFYLGIGLGVYILAVLVFDFGVEGSVILAGGERSLADFGKVALPGREQRSTSACTSLYHILE
jgi:hypothetical protein